MDETIIFIYFWKTQILVNADSYQVFNNYTGNFDHTFAKIKVSVTDPCPTQVVTPTGPVTLTRYPGSIYDLFAAGQASALFSLSEASNSGCQISDFILYKDGQPLADQTIIDSLTQDPSDSTLIKVSVATPTEFVFQLAANVQGVLTNSDDITVIIGCTSDPVLSWDIQMKSLPLKENLYPDSDFIEDRDGSADVVWLISHLCPDTP
jgi:hypothetical protein